MFLAESPMPCSCGALGNHTLLVFASVLAAVARVGRATFAAVVYDALIISALLCSLVGRPNGGGKSTLAYALLGHPGYSVDGKQLELKIDTLDLKELPPEERAKAGLFLAFQSPMAIPGVTVTNLLRAAYQEIYKDESAGVKKSENPVLQRRWQAGNMTLQQFTKKMKEYASLLQMDDKFFSRGIHDGFSGGEKKKLEILQALMLSPKFAIFDEIDTGLDVDALKLVAEGIRLLKQNGTGVIVITHYQRILQYLKPDFVHILFQGKIVESGGKDLAKQIEDEGYKKYSV
jgi:Fe-S cluster assembly ATP-binding protein